MKNTMAGLSADKEKVEPEMVSTASAGAVSPTLAPTEPWGVVCRVGSEGWIERHANSPMAAAMRIVTAANSHRPRREAPTPDDVSDRAV